MRTLINRKTSGLLILFLTKLIFYVTKFFSSTYDAYLPQIILKQKILGE